MRISRGKVRFVLPIISTIIMTSITMGFFSLKQFYIPSERTLYSNEMLFDRIVDAGNSRYSRTQAFFYLDDDSTFKFHSNGLMLRYVRENLVSGQKAVVYWFDPCHELIPRQVVSCVEVIKVNDSLLEDGQKSYLEDRESTFIFYAILYGILILILLFGVFLTLTKWNSVSKYYEK